MTNTEIVEQILLDVVHYNAEDGAFYFIGTQINGIRSSILKALDLARAEGRAEYKREYEMIQKVTDASSAGQLVGRNGGCCNYGGAGCDGGGGAGCDGGGSR